MKNLILSLIFISLAFFCSANDKSQIATELIGTWIWIKSSGGISGVTSTPATTGNEIKIEFSSEKYTKYINGFVDNEMTYKIEKGNSIRKTGDTYLIIYENDQKQSIELIGKKLILFDECYDCYQNEYVKK